MTKAAPQNIPVGLIRMGRRLRAVDPATVENLKVSIQESGWFGAIVVPTSVYLASSDFSEGVPSDAARCDLDGLVKAVLKLTQIAPATGEYLGPRPLAARRG